MVACDFWSRTGFDILKGTSVKKHHTARAGLAALAAFTLVGLTLAPASAQSLDDTVESATSLEEAAPAPAPTDASDDAVVEEAAPEEEAPALEPAAAALANPLVPGTYAGDDASGPDVVVFSNDGFTDPSEEDWDITTVLLTITKQVVVTNGGDATATTWQTLLSGTEVLVLPEGSNWRSGGTAAISDAAMGVIADWTEAGGLIIGTGSYDHADVVSELTGVDYSDLFSNNDGLYEGDAAWDLQISDPELPNTVPNGDYTGGLVGFSAWPAEAQGLVVPVYYDADEDNLAVGAFVIGSGTYVYMAYDWFPDEDELTNGVRADWDATLKFAAGGKFSASKGLTIDLDVEVGDQLANQEIRILAVGLRGGADWNMVLRSDPVLLGSGIVPSSGIVNTSVTFPSSLPVGWHRLIFTSQFDDGSSAEWVRWLHIAADGTLLELSEEGPSPSLAATGTSGLVGIGVGFAALLMLAGGLVFYSARRGETARS